MTKMGGCDSLGAVVLQGNTPIPPRTAVDWYRGTTSPDDSEKKKRLKFEIQLKIHSVRRKSHCTLVRSTLF